MASDVLLARMISMIMPLQSQQMFIMGPRLAWLDAEPEPAPEPMEEEEEGFLVGRVMDCERCNGRFPFCWSSTVALLRSAAGEALAAGGAAEEGGHGPVALSGSEK